ncbi:MAG: hypothetical protein FE78DRAFT_540628, partial [Acidomyces sp. 'richmondensis']
KPGESGTLTGLIFEIHGDRASLIIALFPLTCYASGFTLSLPRIEPMGKMRVWGGAWGNGLGVGGVLFRQLGAWCMARSRKHWLQK